jgi:hypothetical protein
MVVLDSAYRRTDPPRRSRDPVNTQEPRNNLTWRVHRLEDDVKELKQGQPAVLAERVARLSLDIRDLRQDFDREIVAVRNEQSSQRKILISFLVSVALMAVLVVIAYLVTGVPAA